MKQYKLKVGKEKAGRVIRATKDLIVYKKVRANGPSGKAIAILMIPKGTRIVVAKNFMKDKTLHKRKLRAEIAYCVGIIPFNDFGKRYESLDAASMFYSIHRGNFMYEVGAELKPDVFSTSTESFCKGGVHFFAELKDAERYS